VIWRAGTPVTTLDLGDGAIDALAWHPWGPLALGRRDGSVGLIDPGTHQAAR